jgi:type IV pilus assembly protein PilX
MRTARLCGAQRGVTMVLVLLLMSAMLLGALALARITEVGTLAAGNSSFREASLQASEVGINNAYAAVKALTSQDANAGNWYWATMQTTDAAGIPAVNWETVPEVLVGPYAVRHVVERMCSTTSVADPLRECLVKLAPVEGDRSAGGGDQIDPKNARQFRITVRVRGPKDTETWVQSMVTKGS